MINYIFNNDFINDIKKSVINFISRANINVNKITFNLSLYTKFIISDDDKLYISTTHPTLVGGRIKEATINIGGGYFDKIDNDFYIKPEYEDDLIFEITRLLIKGAALNIEYSGSMPISILGNGFAQLEKNAFDRAFNSLLSEDINNYSSPDFEDLYSFNKGVMRMILAIVGYKAAIASYFNHDKSLSIALYSLSVDSNIFVKIYDKMNLINRLINTKNNDSIKTDLEIKNIDNLLELKKIDLLNLIINKLYIPYINSVPFDKRKKVRDEILKGFLGSNFANLKINDLNKENYYYASYINNTVPINNKITEQSWNYFRNEAEEKYNTKLQNIYVDNTLYYKKNNIKEFFLETNNGKTIIINSNKREITEQELVLETLSYAYISNLSTPMKEKLENGINTLCNTKKAFKVALKGNALDNRLLIAAVIKLADKIGYVLEPLKIEDANAYFKKKEPI